MSGSIAYSTVSRRTADRASDEDGSAADMDSPEGAPNQALRTWLEIQSDTFLRWVNYELEERNLSVYDVCTGFRDGVGLICLIELLEAQNKVKLRHYPDPVNVEESEYNIRVALQHLMGRKALLFNIEPRSVMEGDPPMMLSLIWSLVFYYKLSGRWTSWDALRDWVNQHIGFETKYRLQVNNFTTDWNDGRRICALVDAFLPGAIPNAAELLDDDWVCCELGITTAFEEMNVPPILTPEDMANKHLDELSLITYLSLFWETMRERAAKLNIQPYEFVDLPVSPSPQSSVRRTVTPATEGARLIIDEDDDDDDDERSSAGSPRSAGGDTVGYDMADDNDGAAGAQPADDDDEAQLIPPPPPPLPQPPSTRSILPRRRSARQMEGLVVRVVGGPSSAVAVDEGKNSRRGLSYVPHCSRESLADLGDDVATYEVHVSWRGTPVEGSPFLVDARQLPGCV